MFVMRKIIFLLILTCLIGCEKKNEKHDKLFDPEKLGNLELAKINGFWNEGSINETSVGNALFTLHPGFLGGIELFDEDHTIVISVFTTRDTAIIAMKSRIANIATPIHEGTSDEIEGTWWLLNDSWNSAVFVNQWNTIIEVLISDPSNEGVESILYTTANELAKRVDQQSE